MNISTPSPGGGSANTPNNALDLGQAVVVTMPKEVLDAATKAAQAGRILAEVIAQQGQNATLNTPNGAFIIKTDSPLTVGQVVMLRLDPDQLQAQAARTMPVDNVAISSPTSVYNIPLSPTMAPQINAVETDVEPLPQPYWRGQLAPVDIPEDPTELLHVLQDVYQPGVPLEPGRAAPVTALPPSINEGVAKFFALTQLLREMEMLPPQLDKQFFFLDTPPDDANALLPAGPSKLTQGLQSLQGLAQNLQDSVMPTAQKAAGEVGSWLKAKLPGNVLNQIDQLKDSLQKNLTNLQTQIATPAEQSASPQAISFAFPTGTSLLQVWQNAMQGHSAGQGQAPFLLLNMLGLQKPGQVASGMQSGLSQLMAQFKQLNAGGGAVIPTLVLPGNGQRNPVLFSPYGLMFSNTSTVLSGKAPLLPGTVIFWSPVNNPQPVNVAAPLSPLPFWPAGKAMPASVFEWPDLNQLFREKDTDPAIASVWQNQIQNLIPSSAQPDRLGGAILLMMHALNRSSVGAWIGDKTIDALRNEDKQNIIARLVSDFATSAGRVIDPQQPDAQRFVLPLILPEQMAKMVWQVRRDFPEGGQDEPDAQQRKKKTRTHFTVDVPTATLGDLHMDGTVWKEKLDLNLQTAQPLTETMQNGIRERFQTALSITGMSGQIVFQS